MPTLTRQVDNATRILTTTSVEDQSNMSSLFDTISNVQKTLADTSISFERGLLYRIERSRYYVKQFRDGLKGLRIKRIEGFQPYDTFVERRLGATFDFIDRLGHVYSRLENHLNSLYQYFLAKNGLIINSGIEKRNEDIRKIQVAAEIFFLALPAPYYSMGIIEHLAGEERDPSDLYIVAFIVFGITALLRYVYAKYNS